MKCVNCSNDAIYTIEQFGANTLDYCKRCLPKRLEQQAAAGAFPLRKLVKPKVEDKTESKSE